MTKGVLYVMEGTKLAARLTVSIHSLRRHFPGPIAVASGDPSAAAICERLKADQRLDVVHIQFPSHLRITHHRGYILKTLVHQVSPFDTSVFLDCDTLVRGSIDELFELPSPNHMLTTQFCNWGTTRGVVRRRIEAWADLFPELVADAIRYGRTVNTGVFAFTANTQAFDQWFLTALAGQDRFIPDETALQLLLPRFPAKMLDQRFNCSPKFGDPTHDDTRIIHFHGRKHTGQFGGLWLAAYEQVVAENIADIQDWTPATDRQLRNHVRSMSRSKP